MTASAVVAALAAGAAVLLAVRSPTSRGVASLVVETGRSVRPRHEGILRRWRVVLALLAGSAGVTVVHGRAGAIAGVLAAAAVWVLCTRAEPPGMRREREAVRRGLPHVVRLLAVVLADGQSVPTALGVVSEALPGPASASLARACSALAVGVTAEEVWGELAGTPGLEPLGRALQRSSESGAGVGDVVARLAGRLAADERAAVEDKARTVGIRAAVPLGLCLLPAFLLIGIVPVVAAALSSLRW